MGECPRLLPRKRQMHLILPARVFFVRHLRRSVLALAVAAAAAIGLHGQSSDRLTADAFKEFEFRSIGPSLTTGRIQDVAIDPKNPSVWYVAAASGNLWKTDNRGNTFTPIF